MRTKLGLLLVLLLFNVGIAQAHTVTQVGDYAIIAAWENEPPIIGEWNTLTVDIWNTDGEPLGLNDVTLRQFELVSGDETRAAAPSMSPQETVRISVSFVPTIVGEIGVHLVGMVEEESVDVVVYPERVEPANIVHFPNVVLSNDQLQDALIALEGQIATLQTQLVTAYIVAAAGLFVAIISFIVLRRKK